MATGENAGTWGQITNTNLVVIQQAIAGYQAISIAGGAQTTALVMTQNAVSTARNAVIKLTGTITGNQIVTVPNGIEKTWIVSNGTVGAFTVNFKYASTGTGQTWTTTDKGIKILYSDGTDIQVVDLSTLSGTVATAQIANLAVTTAKLDTAAVTAVKITQSTITQAKLASNSVGATQIIQSTITQAKLAQNSVGSNQLISTGVTPASYTSASITVDADGRITAASSGSGGAGGFVPTRFTNGPTSGTHTASPAANRLSVYLYGGAGGGQGGSRNAPGGTSTGSGGFGYFNVPIVQPYAVPFSVGGGGGGGGGNLNPAGGAGGAGGTTTFDTNLAANGGNGAPGGNPGTSPLATLVPPNITFVTGKTSQGGAGGGAGGDGQGDTGGTGAVGSLVVFENIGT
jgi:hypothetical protein